MSLASGTPGKKDRPHGTPSTKSRYQRIHHHDDDHHHHHESMAETVDREMTPGSPSTIFRGRGGVSLTNATSNSTSLPTTTTTTTASSTPDRPAWTALSTEDITEKERRSDAEEEEDDDGDHDMIISLPHATSRSLVSSAISPNTSREWLDEDELQDDDNDMIRRYHHVIHTRVPTLPAEFSGKRGGGGAANGQEEGVLSQVWTALGELRQGARQRRAARLLNPNSRHDFCQTWFCDATDRGIALAAAVTAAWIVMGMLTQAKAGYWWLGLLLFIIRVSARSVYEAVLERKRLQKRNNSTMSLAVTTSASNHHHHHHALELSPGNVNGGANSNTLYRDQEGPLMATPIV